MDTTRLLADGIPVALADGEKVTVRFDFEAMMRVEADFGSTLEFAKKLDARQTGALFTAVLGGLRVAVKERAVTAADLDPSEVMEYRSALIDAWLQAMPASDDDAGKVEGRIEAPGGIGSGSTSSAPSGSAAATVSGSA